MEEHLSAEVTVALALAAGMIAQSLARHLKLPGIVLLLASGVLLGPDVLGVVRPETLGHALHTLVGFAVAVILFEGGLNLGLSRLRLQAKVIQRLITVGAVVTAVGGSLAARFVMGWGWELSIAFGALVVVTGPTVVTPLLRRIKVTHKVETVLEAEGVLIDAIGAILAVVTLQVLISPHGSSIADAGVAIVSRLGFGIVCGVAGGALIAIALRFRKVIPDGLENVFTLSLVLALFQLSNAWLEESGIMTVTAAGMVVGNIHTRVQRELMEFKEQLTIMLIGMLFVLLAADVRIANVLALGVPGALTVACLMLIVRPINIAVSTMGSDLSSKERVFLSWLAPRGVVAAAVASLFAQTFSASGIEGGEQLTALVFTVIAATVLIQGLSGGLVARMLGLRRPVNRGYAIFGANPLGQTIGRQLRDAGKEVIFLERDPIRCKAVEEDGFRVIYGNILEERTMMRAQIEDRLACIAVTTNQEVNLLVARTVNEEFKVEEVLVACRKDRRHERPLLGRGTEAPVLFGKPRDLDLWDLRLRRGIVTIECWRLDTPLADGEETRAIGIAGLENRLLPLRARRGSKLFVVSSKLELRKGDEVYFAVFDELKEETEAQLRGKGWSKVDEAPAGVIAAGEGEQETVPV